MKFGGAMFFTEYSMTAPELAVALEERGYAVIETPLHAFLRSGGSACCLTLRLDHRSSAEHSAAFPPARRSAARETG